jgi:hypothetical protein
MGPASLSPRGDHATADHGGAVGFAGIAVAGTANWSANQRPNRNNE